eukprot:CAMPEP_0183346474 /NCGR_PEP_ID=MMETSP0164_2-20130417/11589_1 /TAXON_ID=221442 /ORGANISM="Coccolithus pelagicus ssp braarudi, Strain PLY182g" /LENGTH=340 /DNA_ID=CAMNT_0025517759 /DNA_START=239 /DNA_END=1259 /DNA_ORIENTATION=+
MLAAEWQRRTAADSTPAVVGEFTSNRAPFPRPVTKTSVAPSPLTPTTAEHDAEQKGLAWSEAEPCAGLEMFCKASLSEMLPAESWSAGGLFYSRVGIRLVRRNPITPRAAGEDSGCWYAFGSANSARTARKSAFTALFEEVRPLMPAMFADYRPTLPYHKRAEHILRTKGVTISFGDVAQLTQLASQESIFGFDSEGQPAVWAQFAFPKARVVCIVRSDLGIVKALLESPTHTKVVWDLGTEERVLVSQTFNEIRYPVADMQNVANYALHSGGTPSLRKFAERGWLLGRVCVTNTPHSFYHAFDAGAAAGLSHEHQMYMAADAWITVQGESWLRSCRKPP